MDLWIDDCNREAAEARRDADRDALLERVVEGLQTPSRCVEKCRPTLAAYFLDHFFAQIAEIVERVLRQAERAVFVAQLELRNFAVPADAAVRSSDGDVGAHADGDRADALIRRLDVNFGIGDECERGGAAVARAERHTWRLCGANDDDNFLVWILFPKRLQTTSQIVDD